MLLPIIFAIFCMQAGVFARSLESSTSLSGILSEGLNENRPIIIVLLNHPDRHNHFDFRDDTLRKPASSAQKIARSRDSCREYLRQKLRNKCTDNAICKEVIWKAAEILCDDNNENEGSAGKLASYIF